MPLKDPNFELLCPRIQETLNSAAQYQGFWNDGIFIIFGNENRVDIIGEFCMLFFTAATSSSKAFSHLIS